MICLFVLLFVCLFSSYKRSAALSQFVIHRGLIISVMQVREGEGRGKSGVIEEGGRGSEEGRRKEGKEVGGGEGEGEGLRITSFMSCRQFSVPCSTLQLLPCMKVFSWLGKF